MALRVIEWVNFMILQRRQSTRQNLQAKIFLIAQPISAPLNHPDRVVQSFYKAKRNLVLRLAVSRDALPMPVDHVSKLLVGFQPLPFQTVTPVLEEAPRPALPLVTPKLSEGLFQQISGVQAFVRLQESLQGLPALQGQVLPVRQQGIFLALDVGAVFALEPGLLGFTPLIQRLAQVTPHVKLVEQDRRLRGGCLGGVAEGGPHVHHRQAKAFRPLFPQPFVEWLEAFLRAVLAAEPDWAAPDQIAYHNPTGMALADRERVDADDLGDRRAHFGQLRPQVLFLQSLDGRPVEFQLRRHRFDRGVRAAPTRVVGKPPGIQRMVRQPVQSFALHLATAPAGHAPQFELQRDPGVATGQVPHPPDFAVVPAVLHRAANAAQRFFERRTRVTIRAFGSPKTPRTVACRRKPGNLYVSDNRRGDLRNLAMGRSCQKTGPLPLASNPVLMRLAA